MIPTLYKKSDVFLSADSPFLPTVNVISWSRHANGLEAARMVSTQCFDLPISKRKLQKKYFVSSTSHDFTKFLIFSVFRNTPTRKNCSNYQPSLKRSSKKRFDN